MDNQLAIKNEDNPLIFTLERQNEQGVALVETMRNIIKIEANMKATEKRVNNRLNENEAILEKLSEQLTINYDEQQEIKSIINTLATVFAREHEKREKTTYSGNLFKAWKGRFISRMHAKLKIRMNVVRYTAIRKVDFKEAFQFLESLQYESFREAELKPTPSILRIIELERSDVNGIRKRKTSIRIPSRCCPIHRNDY